MLLGSRIDELQFGPMLTNVKQRKIVWEIVAARSNDAILTSQGMLENFHSQKHDFQIFIGFNWIFLLLLHSQCQHFEVVGCGSSGCGSTIRRRTLNCSTPIIDFFPNQEAILKVND